jgi:hypothetical protein
MRQGSELEGIVDAIQQSAQDATATESQEVTDHRGEFDLRLFQQHFDLVALGQGKRRGRPPAWMAAAQDNAPKRRGRPAGSKNKPKA